MAVVSLYDKYVLPRVINCACGSKPFMKQRALVVPQATGVVLEVGIGTGLNLPFYDSKVVDRVIGLDPSLESWKLAARRTQAVDFEVEFIGLPEEGIPLEPESVDTVLVTFSLCTIPDPVAALRSLQRVLRAGGKLIFCEHGRSPDLNVFKWQNRLNGVWGSLAGGCHLNRDIPGLIQESGFAIEEIDTRYLTSTARFASFVFWGVASLG